MNESKYHLVLSWLVLGGREAQDVVLEVRQVGAYLNMGSGTLMYRRLTHHTFFMVLW